MTTVIFTNITIYNIIYIASNTMVMYMRYMLILTSIYDYTHVSCGVQRESCVRQPTSMYIYYYSITIYDIIYIASNTAAIYMRYMLIPMSIYDYTHVSDTMVIYITIVLLYTISYILLVILQQYI